MKGSCAFWEETAQMDPVRKSISEQFDSNERTGFLATLLRLARADDVSPSERDRLQPVAEWLGASPEELSLSMQRADDPTLSMEDLVAGLAIGDAGVLLFRECCAVVWVDGVKSQKEAELLDDLGQVLGVCDRARAIMDSPLACSPEGERRFLVLLGGTNSARIEEH